MIQRSSLPKISRIFASTVLCASSTLFFVLSSSEPTPAQQGRFFCGRTGGEYVTYARNSQGAFPMIRWTKWSPGRWTHRERCLAIAQRFNRFWADGSPTLRAGTINNLPVICRTNGAGNCVEVGITFPLGTDANSYLQQLKAIASGAGIPELQLSEGDNAPFSYDSYGHLTVNLRSYVNLNGLPTENYGNIAVVNEAGGSVTPQPSQAPNPSYGDDGVVDMDGINRPTSSPQEPLFEFEIVD